MSDSFFTARNQFDHQMAGTFFDAVACDMLAEAAVRKMATLRGPLHAAERMQRLADICAGAHVLPVEHWQTLGKATAAAPVEPAPQAALPRRWRLWLLIRDNPSIVFWTGFFVGWFWREAFWE